VKSIELAAQAEMTIILYAINIQGADGNCIVSERRLLWFLSGDVNIFADVSSCIELTRTE
jgi:hypothetical protein